jgi:hypothetical protein
MIKHKPTLTMFWFIRSFWDFGDGHQVKAICYSCSEIFGYGRKGMDNYVRFVLFRLLLNKIDIIKNTVLYKCSNSKWGIPRMFPHSVSMQLILLSLLPVMIIWDGVKEDEGSILL